MPLYNLANRRLEDTYPNITQVSKSSVSPDKWSFADGLGNPVTWFDGTASYASGSGNAISASWADTAAFSLQTKAAGIEWDIQLNSASATNGVLGVAELGRGYYNWNEGAWTFGNRITGSYDDLVGSWSFHTNKDNYALGQYSIAHGYKNIAGDSADSVEGYYTSTLNDTVTSLNLNFVYDSINGTLTSLQPGDFTNELNALGLTNVNLKTWFYNAVDDVLYPVNILASSIYDAGTDRTYFLISSNFASDDFTGNGVLYYQSFSSTIKGEPLANHAEGDHTIASGDASHAEGKYTWANAVGSHAEGLNTIASNFGSHAEGRNTQAKGDASHTEGSDTIAIGSSAHAEGYATLAQGEFSHAEGFYTIATGDASHAGGRETLAPGYGSRAIGYGTLASGSYSHAEGRLAEAIGIASHAEGYLTTASADYSHAEGLYSKTVGDYSHAEGNATQTIGPYSHAEGLFTRTIGNFSHAEGESTVTVGNNSHAEGYYTVASGAYSHAEGSGSISRGTGSHAEGLSSISSGSYSHAEGYNTRARGYGSHTEGESTEVTANTDYGHAEGGFTYVFGDYSHAEGYGSSASYSVKSAPVANHAEGYFTKALGSQGAHSEGAYTIADGLYSHAEGSGSRTSINSIASHAEGIFTVASGSGQLAIGRYNLHGNTTDYFVIGSGSSDSNRGDVFAVSNTRMFASKSIFFPDLTQSSKSHIVIFDTASGQLFITASTSVGGGLPAPPTWSVQFNSASSFGGTGSFTFRPDLSSSLYLTGSMIISGSGTDRFTVLGSGSGSPITVTRGTQGELFTVTDRLTGSLFSVRDVSGIPVLDVYSDDTVTIGNFRSPGLYTSTVGLVLDNTTPVTLYTLSGVTYNYAIIDYTATSGVNSNSATMTVHWNLAASTIRSAITGPAFINSGAPFTLTPSLSGNNILIRGIATPSGTWTVRLLIRAI